MKSTSTKSLFLFAVSMGAIAVASAACSGGGGGGSNPTPTPTATPANECDIVFLSANAATPANLDAYLYSMPATDWSNGAKTIAINSGDPTVDATYPVFFYSYDPNTQAAQVAGAATSGSFTVGGVPATDPLAQGATFTFTQTDNLKFFDIFAGGTGLQTGSNGAGTIATGSLSDPTLFDAGSTAAPTFVDGSVTVRVNSMGVNSNLTIGGTGGAYAVCYYYAAFAPVTPVQHATQVLNRVLAAKH